MAAADTIMVVIGSETKAPMSGCAAMKNTSNNPNVHLAHEVRDWLVALGHTASEEYELVVRRCKDDRRVGSLLVLPASAPILPARERQQQPATADWLPNTVQKKVIQSLRGDKRMSKKSLAGICGDRVYLRVGGLDDMVSGGALLLGDDAKYELSDMGNGLAAELFDEAE